MITFYPVVSHDRTKETADPLRSLRLCGEDVTQFMKWTPRHSLDSSGQLSYLNPQNPLRCLRHLHSFTDAMTHNPGNRLSRDE